MSTRFLGPILLAGAALATAGVARAAEGDSLPPPAPGREVVLDSRVMVGHERPELTLSDLDPETADIVREINRKPGTWQTYLLYTAEDLPEIMFHPGFAIRLPSRRRPAPPDFPPPEETAPAAPKPPAPPPPPAKPAAPQAPTAPR